MATSNIKDEERALFEEWAKRYPKGFFHDGVPSPDGYLSSKVRVVFVLREANFGGEQKDYDFRNELHNGPHRFWKQKVAPWCYGLAESGSGEATNDLWNRREVQNDGSRCIAYLLRFGFIQIKKSPGKSSAKPNEILEAARQDCALIRRQIGIYKPDIIVACGIGHPKTFDLLFDFVFGGSIELCPNSGFKRRCAKVHEVAAGKPSTFLIETHHPSHRTERKVVFDQLISDFRAALALRQHTESKQGVTTN